MLRKILPVLLIVLGLALGLGGGFMLRPDRAKTEAPDAADTAGAEGHDAAGSQSPAAGSEEPAAPEGDPHAEDAAAEDPAATGEAEAHGEAAAHDYVKLNNQFIVPVVENGRVAALVILSLSLEVTPGSVDRIYAIEPKLRDALLQVMFDHANSGGFSGSFTDSANLVLLRKALLEAAMRVAGADVSDVLIVDIVRQDS